MSRSCEENENSWTDTNSNSDNDSTGPGKLVNSSSLKILTGPQGVIKICTSGESVCSREIRSVPLAQNKKVTVISSTPPVHKLSSRNSPTYCACESKTHRTKGLRSSSISVQTYSLARKRFPDESSLVPIQSPVNSCSTIATYGSMQSCSTLTETTQTRVSFANKKQQNVKPIDNKSSRYNLYKDCDNNRMVPSLPATVPENTAKTIHISLTNDGPSSYSAYAQQEGAYHVSSQTTAAKPKYTENRVQRICRKLNFCKGPSVRSRTHKCGSQTDGSSVIKVPSKHKQYGADLQTNHPSSTIIISTPTKPKHLLLQLTQSRSICSLPYHPPIANHSSSTHI